ncbi:hypothetical protein FRB95_000996 [Tulasnella sp. JGI-2019a]|nr:hypothetical protein FRB95_000996 [Tulasnella sp. JGI-2019a]
MDILVSDETDPDSRAKSLFKLALDYWRRFEQNGDRGDLDQSIKYDQEALKIRSEGHPDRGSSLNNLAIGLRTRFSQTGDRDDLDQSIKYNQEALKIWSEGHPNRGLSLSGLALGLRTPFKKTGDRGGLVASLHLAREGATHELSPVIDRLRASSHWVQFGKELDDPSVLEAYMTQISLLDRYITFARSIGAQHSRLTTNSKSIQTADLASEATSYALQKSLPVMAIELLEQGRSILYSQLGKYHTSLIDLEAVNPKLANQFKVLSMRLEDTTSNEDH